LKKWFSPRISSKPPSPQETEQKKEKEKLQESLQIKGKLIFWEEKDTSTSKILFNVILYDVILYDVILQLQKTLHHMISKNLSKIIEKVFLTLFGPSFSLAIYMTWIVPFLLTHELHILSL
jgi:hypothetical protein